MDGSPPTLTPTPTPAPANNEPQFPAESAARSVAENAPAGESVGDPVTATDGDTLTYALMGSNDFTIDDAGQIMVASGATLDYETTPIYSVTVTVHDGKNVGGEADDAIHDSIEVAITITNVDEAGTADLDTETPQVGSAVTANVTESGRQRNRRNLDVGEFCRPERVGCYRGRRPGRLHAGRGRHGQVPASCGELHRRAWLRQERSGDDGQPGLDDSNGSTIPANSIIVLPGVTIKGAGWNIANLNHPASPDDPAAHPEPVEGRPYSNGIATLRSQ